ncbi:MAG: dTMP kinase [Cyanobacteriota bacterium]|jgi:dTMP kinase
MEPLFIVLEGIDGSGKTTQAERLLSYFQRQNQSAVLSPEPTAGPIGQLLRRFLAGETPPFSSPQQLERQMGYLFAADRHYHLFNQTDGVLSYLRERRSHVIVPRYYCSSLAYNAHGPEDWAFIERLNREFPPPDVLIYLDLTVEAALKRLTARRLEYYEKADTLEEVRRNYQTLLERYPYPKLILDGAEAPDRLERQMIEFLSTQRPQD